MKKIYKYTVPESFFRKQNELNLKKKEKSYK